MIGRSAELRRIEDGLRAAHNQGSALVVVGDPGIGKSTLLMAAEDRAAQMGLKVLRTAGVEAESRFGFAALHRLLRPILPLAERLPELLRSALLSAVGLEEGGGHDPLMVNVSTLALLDEASKDEPVAIVVDDAHWLDSSTRDVILYAADRARQTKLFVLAASRPAYESQLGNIPTLKLGGLARPDAETLLSRRSATLSPEARERLLVEAQGNPLALVELPSLVSGSGPDAPDAIAPALTARIERAFAARFAEMPEATKLLLLTAAADEASSVSEVVSATKRLESAKAIAAEVSAEALAPAVEAGLISVSGDLAWRHPLVRSAVYHRSEPLLRQQIHQALADEFSEDPDRRAWHRSLGTIGRDDEVADEVAAMADRLRNRGAILDAAQLLHRSAELTVDSHRRVARLIEAGELAFQLGRRDLVDKATGELLSLDLGARDSARVELLAEAFSDGVAGDVDRVRSLVTSARSAESDGDVDLTLELLRGAALRCWWGAMPEVVRGEVLRAVEAVGVDRHDPRRLVTVAIVAPFDRAEEVLLGVGVARDHYADDLLMTQLLGIAAHAVGDHAMAIDLLSPLVERLREQGRLGLLAQVESMLQWDAIMLGSWPLAKEWASEGSALAHETSQPVWGAGITCGLAAVAAAEGDEERAEELAADAEVVVIPHRLADMHSVLLTARGISAVASGRYEHALSLFARVFDPSDPAYHYREQFGAVTYAAEAAFMSSREETLRPVIESLSRLPSDKPPAPIAFSIAYARALLADDQAARLRQLLESNVGMNHFDRSRVSQALGVALLRSGDLENGTILVRAAADGFDLASAPGWARGARGLLQ